MADQPYLKAETLERFVEAFQKSGKSCACVRYGNRTGNPCIFTAEYQKELLELAGDIGGKRVINKHLDETFFYDVEEEQELEDIDENNLQFATIKVKNNSGFYLKDCQTYYTIDASMKKI